MTSFSRTFLADSIKILDQLDDAEIEAMVEQVRLTRERGGRIFFCGSGGGAGHASHAACDFRKLARVECYAVTDNVSELTARINDDGWDSSYAEWLKTSKLSDRDCLFVFSVGGGTSTGPSAPTSSAPWSSPEAVGASIVGVAGRDGGELRATRRRVRAHHDGRRAVRDAADRGPPGARLAPRRVTSGAGAGDREMGVRHRRVGSHHERVIITRTPLRISLGGGGTDLPGYYRERGAGSWSPPPSPSTSSSRSTATSTTTSS